MNHIYDRDILDALEFIRNFLQILWQSQEQNPGDDFFEGLLYYIVKKGEISDRKRFSEIIADLFPETGDRKMPTIAQMYYDDGQQQGIQLGVQQGIQQGLHQKSIHIAKNMLAKGSDLAFIEEVTGVTMETLALLQQQEELI